MFSRLRAKSDAEHGFTLIELLVVIIIIGILAAIAIPVFLTQRKKGYDASVKSDLRNMGTAEETYLVDNTVYTSTLANLTSATGPALKTSSNNSFKMAVSGSTAYCTVGSNSGSGAYYAYDSAAGGLLSTTYVSLATAKAATSCSAYTWVGTLT
jgi:type IV pilus assembly protein PilA